MTEHAYIHIPFCLKKCRYCSFVSGFDIALKTEYSNALLTEIKKKYKGEKLKTLYIGGGTPSLLSKEEIQNIISVFDFSENAEITLEANPGTVTSEKLKAFKTSGINRISFGAQTFNEDILKYIGRSHNEDDIFKCVKDAENAGFDNISIDLIYGLPFQNPETFKNDLEKAVKLNIRHISTYGLKIEPESYFGQNPPENLPDDEMQAEMYLYLCEFLEQNGFIHYEISNFAKPGFESRHNGAYWKNKNYYGFGLNASGYEGKTRYTNTRDFNEYMKNPLKKSEITELSEEEIKEEELFLALRLREGIDIKAVNKKFGIDFCRQYASIIEKYTSGELLKIENDRCFLTEQGFLLSNEIMSEFV